MKKKEKTPKNPEPPMDEKAKKKLVEKAKSIRRNDGDAGAGDGGFKQAYVKSAGPSFVKYAPENKM